MTGAKEINFPHKRVNLKMFHRHLKVNIKQTHNFHSFLKTCRDNFFLLRYFFYNFIMYMIAGLDLIFLMMFVLDHYKIITLYNFSSKRTSSLDAIFIDL